MDEQESCQFEQRLRAARQQHGLDKSGPGHSDLPPASAWGLGLRVGVELVSALGISVLIGLGLDHWLHTLPVFLCLFVLLGGAAGVLNVWRLMAPKPGRPPPTNSGLD